MDFRVLYDGVLYVLQGDYEAALKIFDEQVSGLKIAHGCVCTGISTEVVLSCACAAQGVIKAKICCIWNVKRLVVILILMMISWDLVGG